MVADVEYARVHTRVGGATPQSIALHRHYVKIRRGASRIHALQKDEVA